MLIFSVLAVVIGYLLGNLNGAVCISHLFGDDVRSHGSGNAGLTNFIRNYGTGKSAAVIAIDAGKAVMGCVLGGLLLHSYAGFRVGAALGGTGVLLGHVFPVFLGFRGGKGILSGLFVALMVDWRVAVLILLVFGVTYLLSQYVSLGSVLASVSFAVGFSVFHHNEPVTMTCGIFMGVLAIFMHRQNILRLIRGEERKTNLFKKDKTA